MNVLGDIAEADLTGNSVSLASQLQTILNVIPAYAWYTTPAGGLAFVNTQTADYLGLPPDSPFRSGTDAAVPWDAHVAFLHPDEQEDQRNHWEANLRAGVPCEVTFRVRDANGNYRWFLSRGAPLRAGDGTLLHWVGVNLDIDDLKRAEERLRRGEAYLAEAQKLSCTGSSVFNTTSIVYWSDETYRIFEFDPRDGLPTREAVVQRIHSDDRERVTEIARQAVLEKKDYGFEFKILLPSGRIRNIEQMARPKFSGTGELVEIVCTLMDVTERQRAQQAVRQSEEKFRDYAETASDWFWEIGPDYKFTLLTENAFGAPGNRLGTYCWDHALDADTEPEKWQIVRATMNARKPFRDFTYLSVRADGTPMYVKASGKPVLDANGEFRGYRGTGSDVTAIKGAERALRESEARFRDYAETASDWFWEMGPDYRLVLRTADLSGVDPATRLGTSAWDQALDVETEPDKWREWKATLDAHKPFRDFTYLSGRQDGTPRYVKASGKPLFGPGGEFRGYRGTGTDVTPLVRAQAERERLRQLESDLAHLNRLSMMGELAASLAHEIAQPISAAHNNARAAMNFLERGAPDVEHAKEALAGIIDDADRAGHILERIRDHTKKAAPRKEAFDLKAAIQEVITFIARSEMVRNGLTIETRFDPGVIPVQADRVQVQQVVMNLILNAAEAMSAAESEPHKLSIAINQDSSQGIVVSVSDTGPGIRREDRERIFQAFYTTKANGVGMGLAICRSIIEAHGGRLWVEPSEPKGAAFRFTLPTGA